MLTLVIIDVVGDAGLTAKHQCFLFGFELFSAREQTTAGNSIFQEGGVVRATTEFSFGKALPVPGEEVLEFLLNLSRSVGTSEVKRRSISIVDSKHVVWRGNHIEVEIP